MEKGRANKRVQFVAASEAKAARFMVGFFVAIAILSALAIGAGFLFRSRQSAAKSVTSEGGAIHIPLAEIGPRAQFYKFKTRNNKMVRFFVIKSSDGVYRAAADACELCYRDKRGYHQEGDDMVCNKCGRRFASKDVNEVTEGCRPNSIPRSIEGNNLVIAATELEARAILF